MERLIAMSKNWEVNASYLALFTPSLADKAFIPQYEMAVFTNSFLRTFAVRRHIDRPTFALPDFIQVPSIDIALFKRIIEHHTTGRPPSSSRACGVVQWKNVYGSLRNFQLWSLLPLSVLWLNWVLSWYEFLAAALYF